jgi:sarcosine oxidase subunit beta
MSFITVDTEFLVIGGGIAGTAAAWRLAEKGREVVLLEKGRIGEEASGRCGGGVRQQYRDQRETPFAIKAVKMWEEMDAVLDEDLEYDQGGNIKLLRSQDEFDQAKARVEREQSQGLGVCLISPEETRERLPFLAPDIPIFGGTHCPTDGTANPLKVTKAIGRAAAKAGAQVRINEPALQFLADENRIRMVRTDNTLYRARNIILAAGPWSGGLLFDLGLRLHLTVKKVSILITQPVPPVIPGFISWDTGICARQKMAISTLEPAPR